MTVVTDLSEIVCKDGENPPVIILEGFLRSRGGLASLHLYKSLLNLDYYFIGIDIQAIRDVQSLAKVFKYPISSLTYDLVEEIVNNRVSSVTEESTDSSAANLEFAESVIRDSNDEQVKSLAEDFIGKNESLNYLNTQLQEVQKTHNSLTYENNKLRLENKNLTSAYLDVMKRAASLNRSLADYQSIITQDLYKKIPIEGYESRPHILYFKEYEQLLHLSSFVQTLREAFCFQEGLATKVLFLFDSYSYNRVKVMPKYFSVLGYEFSQPEVLTNDFLCVKGNYERVFDILLRNQVRADVLLVFDCKLYEDVVLDGAFLPFNMCRNEDHLETFGLVGDNTIVNNSRKGARLSWDHLSDFDELGEDNSARFAYLSSQTVIEKILKVFRLYKNGL